MPVISSVFVVLKDGRRIEDINYATKKAALSRLNILRSGMSASYAKLGLGKDPSKYEIREVDRPNKIW